MNPKSSTPTPPPGDPWLREDIDVLNFIAEAYDLEEFE